MKTTTDRAGRVRLLRQPARPVGRIRFTNLARRRRHRVRGVRRAVTTIPRDAEFDEINLAWERLRACVDPTLGHTINVMIDDQDPNLAERGLMRLVLEVAKPAPGARRDRHGRWHLPAGPPGPPRS